MGSGGASNSGLSLPDTAFPAGPLSRLGDDQFAYTGRISRPNASTGRIKRLRRRERSIDIIRDWQIPSRALIRRRVVAFIVEGERGQ